ncbi:uncharacterized protein RCC_06887 [Ramularia collo-cygni]|uniref:Uncharacterized protein n=1 Tax=Ramularia collo-cygni TaxID=112498 RepID=A0A2D3VBG5_9PEZI|nr:uncharacterized protein RCC_06887 [Ramularia collo-cygni]CZT21026.1 uncharacterized protein RCC_06887 [Ramularia collo-cygni]
MLVLEGGLSITGHYSPSMLFALITMPIGTGLMMNFLKFNTEIARLIVDSGFAESADGIGFQAAQTAARKTLFAADATAGLAIIPFARSFGPVALSSLRRESSLTV